MTCGPDHYDTIYAAKPRYRASWPCTKQAGLFERARAMVKPEAAVLELGCGTGQFAEALAEQCQGSYLGLDFSPVAILMARERMPRMTFMLVDFVAEPPSYEGWDVVVALEVLEHLADDLAVLRAMPAGLPVIFSLPTFGGPGHERHFKTPLAVVTRYSQVLEVESLEPIGLPGTPGSTPWLLGRATRR